MNVTQFIALTGNKMTSLGAYFLRIVTLPNESRIVSLDISSEINLTEELVLDQDAANALFLEARTANSCSDEEISAGTLDAIYSLTRMGPTAMNIQPLRIQWIKSTEARERLVANMNDGNKTKTLGAPMVAILSAEPDWHQTLSTTTPHMAAKSESFAQNEELRQSMAHNNAHIQAGYFIMAARAAGLAAGPMTGFNAAGIDADFNADSDRKVIMVVNLGRPTGVEDRVRLQRLDAETATVTL